SLSRDERAAARIRKQPQLVLLFAGFFALAITFQVFAGVYGAELSGYPDEPAHLITGLMVRDYIALGFPDVPMHFAEDYYLHYPKVAFGHWPPLFYILEGLWTLIFPATRASILLLMAVYTGLTATCLARWTSARFSAVAGIAVAALFTSLPVVQEQTQQIMI